jgi:hypothetical protein
MQCTFCDNISSPGLELCRECCTALNGFQCNEQQEQVFQMEGPGLEMFARGPSEFLQNRFSIRGRLSMAAVAVMITSVSSGATVGAATSIEFGLHPTEIVVQYLVHHKFVSRIRITVAIGSYAVEFIVKDDLYFSGKCVGACPVQAEGTWSLHAVVASDDGKLGVCVNKTTSQWCAMTLDAGDNQPPVCFYPPPAECCALDINIASVAWMPGGTIFSSTGWSCQVLEMDADGILYETFTFGFPTGALAASRTMLAVATIADSDQLKRVTLVDTMTGMVLHKWGNCGLSPGLLDVVTAMRFFPDGEHVVVASTNQRWLSLFTVSGTFVRALGQGTFSFQGDLEVVDHGRTVVATDVFEGTRLISVSTKTGQVTGVLECHEAFSIISLAKSWKGLYALDATLSQVFVYT